MPNISSAETKTGVYLGSLALWPLPLFAYVMHTSGQLREEHEERAKLGWKDTRSRQEADRRKPTEPIEKHDGASEESTSEGQRMSIAKALLHQTGIHATGT
jgi:hypothetical protein